MNNLKNPTVLLLFLAILASASSVPGKKLIEFGWDSPDTQFLRMHIAAMEAAAPVDGIGIDLRAVGKDESGKPLSCGYDRLPTYTHWQYEWFLPAIDNLKHTAFHRFTDNFIRANLGGHSWFDDREWSAKCANFALLARIARETGMAGLAVDPEQYGEKLFVLSEAAGTSREATAAKARQRGREFGQAVFGANPHLKLFFFEAWSAASIHKIYEMLPFLNGVYEAMPSTARFYDGSEGVCYCIASKQKFEQARQQSRDWCEKTVDPVNRDKYRQQTSFMPAMFVDAFFVSDGGYGVWFNRLSKDPTHRLELFSQALRAAFETSDEYVWHWQEAYSWWDCTDFQMPDRWKPKKQWAKDFPGILDAVDHPLPRP